MKPNDEYRILVCGGREYDKYHVVRSVLLRYFPSPESKLNLVIAEGGAKGADFLARVWAVEYGVEYREYKADWKQYGKKAGIIRNVQMLEDFKPDLVLAFPGGSGTKHMKEYAASHGYMVVDVEKDDPLGR